MSSQPPHERSSFTELLRNLARDMDDPDPAVRAAARTRYDSFIGPAYDLAESILRNRDDALDVISIVVERWLVDPERYNCKYRIDDLSWFLLAVKTQAYTWSRTATRKRKKNDEFAAEFGADEGSDEDPMQERIETMYAGINRIAPRDREVLLIYLNWNPPPNPKRIGARLGRELGVSDKTAKARFTTALLSLHREMRILLGEIDPDAPEPGSSR